MIERTATFLLRLYSSSFVKGALLFTFITWLILRNLMADLDLFARLAVGQLVFQHGSVPLTDVFAFTPRLDLWVDHEWLAGTIFFWLYNSGGEAALILFEITAVFLTTVVLVLARRMYAGTSQGEFLTVALFNFSILPLWGLPVRSLLFSYLGVALTLLVITHCWQGKRSRLLLLFPLYGLLWVNAHAGFVIGLALIGFGAVYNPKLGFRINRNLLLLTALFFVATVITPYGFYEFWKFVLPAIFKSRIAIPEWRAINPFSREGFWAALWIMVIGSGLLARRGAPHKMLLLVTALALVSGLRSYRMMAFFYLVAFITSAPFVNALLERLSRSRPTNYQALVESCSLCVVLLLPIGGLMIASTPLRLDKSPYPVAALEWLSANRERGNLLVHFDYGSYALWSLYPRFLVSVDGRYEEVYSDETCNKVAAALDPGAQDHLAALEWVGADLILSGVESVQGVIEPYPGFGEIYRDSRFVLFEK